MPECCISRIESLESRRLLTVLTFDPDGIDGAVLPQDYGDRVQGAIGGLYEYGSAGGTTPNVRASYGPDPSDVRQNRDGYGDFQNNLYADDAGFGILDIYLVADLGFQAKLSSFQLASKDVNRTIKSVRVFDGASNALFEQTNVAVTSGTHTTINAGGAESRVLRIRIDASNLGGNGDQIGIDNIQFSQTSGGGDVGDGYADAVLDFSDSGAGIVAGPFGGSDANEGNVPVGLGVVLGDDSSPLSYLSLPTGSFVVVGFADEEITDGPGDDIAINELVDTGEQAEVYVSNDGVNFTLLGVALAGRTSKFDLSDVDFNATVRAVKVVGLDAEGGSPGFDLLNVQAIAGAMQIATDSGPSDVNFASQGTDGILTVNGTSSDDDIDVTALGGSLDVSRNGTTVTFDASITNRMEIFAEGGNDVVTVGADSPGTYVLAGDGNDSVTGGNAKDTLTGGAGKNTLRGGSGDDRVNGSGAPDSLSGGEGADRLYGNDGDDILQGDGGVDRLFGGNGNDNLSGGSSNDKLYGEAGGDTLSGNNQADLLEGGSGNDLLVGGEAIDTMFGNSGKDIIFAKDNLAEPIDGGSDTDQGVLDSSDVDTSIEIIL